VQKLQMSMKQKCRGGHSYKVRCRDCVDWIEVLSDPKQPDVDNLPKTFQQRTRAAQRNGAKVARGKFITCKCGCSVEAFKKECPFCYLPIKRL
jgi:hypothetical protein